MPYEAPPKSPLPLEIVPAPLLPDSNNLLVWPSVQSFADSTALPAFENIFLTNLPAFEFFALSMPLDTVFFAVSTLSFISSPNFSLIKLVTESHQSISCC